MSKNGSSRGSSSHGGDKKSGYISGNASGQQQRSGGGHKIGRGIKITGGTKPKSGD